MEKSRPVHFAPEIKICRPPAVHAIILIRQVKNNGNRGKGVIIFWY